MKPVFIFSPVIKFCRNVLQLFQDLKDIKRLRALDQAVMRTFGPPRGVRKQIDENRELFELLQDEVPWLLHRRFEIECWLSKMDGFLVDVERHTTPSPWAARVRAWPGRYPKEHLIPDDFGVRSFQQLILGRIKRALSLVGIEKPDDCIMARSIENIDALLIATLGKSLIHKHGQEWFDFEDSAFESSTMDRVDFLIHLHESHFWTEDYRCRPDVVVNGLITIKRMDQSHLKDMMSRRSEAKSSQCGIQAAPVIVS